MEEDTEMSEVTEDLSNLSLEETPQPRTSKRHRRAPPKFTYDVMGEPKVQMMTRTIATESRAGKSRQLNPLAKEFLPLGAPQRMVTTGVNADPNIAAEDKENEDVADKTVADNKQGWLDWLMGKMLITRGPPKKTTTQQI